MYGNEKRIHTRRKFLRDVVCEVFKYGRIHKYIDAKIINISTTGVCVETKNTTEPGAVMILCQHQQDAGTATPVQGPARVMWVAPSWESLAKGRFKIGLQFLE